MQCKVSETLIYASKFKASSLYYCKPKLELKNTLLSLCLEHLNYGFTLQPVKLLLNRVA